MPYKISMWIVLFLLFANAGAVMLDASGATDYLGVSPDPGNPEELEKAQSKGLDGDGFQTGTGGGQTLFGLYNALSNTLTTIISAISPAADMAINVGVPAYLVSYIMAGLVMVPAYDIIIFLRSG